MCESIAYGSVILVLLIMMYDLEKASKSAPGISLYVSDDPKGSNEVLGPDAPSFPDQDGALVYDGRSKLQAASFA